MIGPVTFSPSAIGTIQAPSTPQDASPAPSPESTAAAMATLQSDSAPVENVDTALQISAMNAALDMNKSMVSQLVNMVQAISAYTGNAGASAAAPTINATA